MIFGDITGKILNFLLVKKNFLKNSMGDGENRRLIENDIEFSRDIESPRLGPILSSSFFAFDRFISKKSP